MNFTDCSVRHIENFRPCGLRHSTGEKPPNRSNVVVRQLPVFACRSDFLALFKGPFSRCISFSQALLLFPFVCERNF